MKSCKELNIFLQYNFCVHAGVIFDICKNVKMKKTKDYLSLAAKL